MSQPISQLGSCPWDLPDSVWDSEVIEHIDDHDVEQ